MSEATRAENVAPKPYDLEAHYQELEQKITAAGIPADLGRVRAAFECADRAHSGQKRRDGSPYVSHCIAAAIITAEMGLDEDSIISALLHDTIEDTSLTHEDIARSFGASVADIVEGVTKLTRVQYTSVEEQQMENMRKMLLAMAKDIRVILIKMADRLHNMRTMAYQSEEKQRIKSLETMEIYAPIAHRLGMQKIKWELEDLSLLYLDPAGYKAITDALDERMPTLEKFMGEMRTQIRERLEADGVHATISSRIKHIYSIYRKMYAQKLDINGIFDLCAFRVIVDTIPDCYNVLGIIHDMYKPLPGRFKDYISTPKPKPIRVSSSMEVCISRPEKFVTIAAVRVILITILLSTWKSLSLKNPTRRSAHPNRMMPIKHPACVRISTTVSPSLSLNFYLFISYFVHVGK